MKKVLAILLALVMTFSLAACGGNNSSGSSEETKETAAAEPQKLSEQKLMVFSGAGLSDPVQKIIDTFKEDTGCDVQVVFAATGQLISQIQTSESGDVLIAGAKDELESMKDGEVTDSVELVKHIPVLAVQKGNPLGIKSVADMAKDGTKVLIADPESTPIGKIAIKAFEAAKIKDKIDIEASTSTAPLAITGLAEKEVDAAIVWKENAAANKDVEIVDVPEMEKFIKVVPAASLKYSTNEEARTAFIEFLSSDAAMKIWQDFGYEPADK